MKNNLFTPCLFAFYVMLISCSKDDSSGAGNTPTFDNIGINKSILTSSNYRHLPFLQKQQ